MKPEPTSLLRQRKRRLTVISGYAYCLVNGYIEQDRWTASFYPCHVINTAVLYRHWGPGEYKNCPAANEKTGFELLKCEEIDASKEGGIFKVKFRGQIYRKEIRSDWLDWKCQNNGDEIELRITCWPLKDKKSD